MIASDRFRLEPDLHRPKLASTGICLPAIPVAGEVEIGFDAGFGAAWGDVPADLAQAVLMLAAYFYENRSDVGAAQGNLPFGVTALIQRYRVVRLFGGGGGK